MGVLQPDMKAFNKKTIAIAIAIFIVGCAQNDKQAKQDGQSPTPSEELVFELEQDLAKDRIRASEVIVRQELNKKPEKQAGTKRKDSLVEVKKVEAPAMLMRENAILKSIVPGRASAGLSMHDIRSASETLNRENYAHFEDNATKRVLEHPVSTFSIDVDTGVYANIRRMLKAGNMPTQDAVRTEELINYFSYQYPLKQDPATPFNVHRELAATPWNPDTHLLHIGIKGYGLPASQLPPANLVFLVDVSGSMRSADKLDLLKSSLKLLTKRLGPEDRVSIVVYAGASGVVLQPTSGNDKALIISALDRLSAGGSTNEASGIRLAYSLAEQAFVKGGINRVLLATDGDFNVGTTDIEQLKDLIEEKRKTGIALSTLGFGTGNYNDHLMEEIADVGNGNYAYIDTLNEAQKVLVDEMSSTMLTIAKDVKIQIEFNPARVSEYRLLGYENRMLKREDFNNDKIDAGEVGAGHTVTAIYEISLNNDKGNRIEPLRYQVSQLPTKNSEEIAFLRLRYKEPANSSSKLLEWSIAADEIIADIEQTTTAFRFSAAVASFAQQLRGGNHTGEFQYRDIARLAQQAKGEDPFGYRGEFLNLVKLAESISTPQQQAQVTR